MIEVFSVMVLFEKKFPKDTDCSWRLYTGDMVWVGGCVHVFTGWLCGA